MAGDESLDRAWSPRGPDVRFASSEWLACGIIRAMEASDVVTASIAGLALFVSVLAWWQARRSAHAAERAAVAAEKAAAAAERSAYADEQLISIEAERRHEERRPDWELAIARRQRGATGPRQLTIKLVAIAAVDAVALRSLDEYKLTFTDSQEGSLQGGDKAELVEVRSGLPRVLRVHTPEPPEGGSVKLELTSRRGDDEWTHICEVRLPARPARVISL